MLPDRRGNNRIDSLRNIVRDPRVGLLFLIPGSGNTLRVNGRAQLRVDPALLESFAVEDKAPRSVIGDHGRRASISSAPGPWCAPICGTRPVTSIPGACRRRPDPGRPDQGARRRRDLRPRMAGARAKTMW